MTSYDIMPRDYDKSPDIDWIEAHYKHHHTSTFRGYVSRKKGPIAEEYDGRYGKGYRIFYPRWDSTTYCWVAYYTQKKAEAE